MRRRWAKEGHWWLQWLFWLGCLRARYHGFLRIVGPNRTALSDGKEAGEGRRWLYWDAFRLLLLL